jgi:hypothetical protein
VVLRNYPCMILHSFSFRPLFLAIMYATVRFFLDGRIPRFPLRRFLLLPRLHSVQRLPWLRSGCVIVQLRLRLANPALEGWHALLLPLHVNYYSIVL